MVVLAHDMNDAVNIFTYQLVVGLGHRPDADFSVVQWTEADRPGTASSRVGQSNAVGAWFGHLTMAEAGS